MFKRVAHPGVLAQVLILIASIILFSGCSKSNTKTFPAGNHLRWINSSKGSVYRLCLTSDGEYLAIIKDKEISYEKYRSFFYLFNKEGKILQSYDFQKSISVLDFKFSPDGKYVALARGSLHNKGGQVFLFDKDRLLWSKEIWGKPYFWITPELVAVATYEEIKGFHEDEELPVGKVCIDPDLLWGEYGGSYTSKGKTIFFDTSGKLIREDKKLAGLSKVINGDYFLTSCLENTTVYDKKGRNIWSNHDSGKVLVSSDGKYILIGNSALYAMNGNLLWKKKVKHYVFPLAGGYTITTNAFFGYATYDSSLEFRVLALYDSRGQKVWEEAQGEDGFGPVLFTDTADGKYIVVSFQKKIPVEKPWDPKVKQRLKEFGFPDKNIHVEYINKVLVLDHKKNIVWTSKEIPTKRALYFIETDFSGSHVVVSDGEKIFFYDTGIKR